MSSSSRDRMNDSYKNWTHFQCKNKLWKEGIREYFASQKFTRFFFSIRSTYVHLSSIWLSVVTAIEYYAVYDEFFSLFLCILWHAVRPLAALTTATEQQTKQYIKIHFVPVHTHIFIYTTAHIEYIRAIVVNKRHMALDLLYILFACTFLFIASSSCFHVSVYFLSNSTTIFELFDIEAKRIFISILLCVFLQLVFIGRFDAQRDELVSCAKIIKCYLWLFADCQSVSQFTKCVRFFSLLCKFSFGGQFFTCGKSKIFKINKNRLCSSAFCRHRIFNVAWLNPKLWIFWIFILNLFIQKL